jgi:hypothetical protein
MLPLYEDPYFTFRFADDRIISRFHLEGVEAGRRVSVFRIDPGTGERMDLLVTATVGEGRWVDPTEPIIVRAGEAFIVVPEPEPPAKQHGELFRFRAQPETEVDKPGRLLLGFGLPSESVTDDPPLDLR